MRVVAGRAVARCGRAVDITIILLIGMTLGADFLWGYGQQLRLIGAMWIMTRGAHAVFYRRMDNFLGTDGVMARCAEIWHILDKLECFLAFLGVRSKHGLVACIAGLQDGMDIFRLFELLMAIARCAAFLGRNIGGICYQKNDSKKERYQHSIASRTLMAYCITHSIAR